jgi:hypothetical protein
MPRLVHATTGVTVEVSDETAANLGSEWAPEKADEKPTTRRKSN